MMAVCRGRFDALIALLEEMSRQQLEGVLFCTCSISVFFVVFKK